MTTKTAKPIYLGDIGTIEGDDGYWCVVAGASLLPGIEAVSRSAKKASKVSDMLTVYATGRGERKIPRSAWRG